jgi:hypothetical protein
VFSSRDLIFLIFHSRTIEPLFRPLNARLMQRDDYERQRDDKDNAKSIRPREEIDSFYLLTKNVLYSFYPTTQQQRAYKLGKKKRSYNQVELTIGKASNKNENENNILQIFEAHERPIGDDIPKDLANSALEYELRLTNGTRARCVIYLVYAEPMGETGKETLKRPTSELIVHGEGKMWLPVTRERCNKSCEGPILSAIQRFGKQGRTQPNSSSATTTQQDFGDKSNWKNSKNLFISIDEASNHVRPFGPNKVKAFRLLFTIFELESDANGHAIPNVKLSEAKFIGSGFSTPIRVYANNDVPKGAAAMQVRCSLQSSWIGWKQASHATEEALKEAFADLPPEKHAGGKEEKKPKKIKTSTTTTKTTKSKEEKNAKTLLAKAAAEEKKKQKMLLKAAKELEKERAKAAKQAAAVTAALGANGKTTGKRKNGTATGGARGGQGPMAKKGKLSGLQQRRNSSQAEHIAAMQMYQPYFVPSQSGDAMNAANNVSSIFSPLASGRFPPSSAGGLRRLSDQMPISVAHIAGFNLNELNALQTPATNGNNGSPGNAGGTPPSNVMNNMYGQINAAAYAHQQERAAAAAILSMGTPPDQQLQNTLGGDSTLMKGFTVDGEFISTADLPAMCTPPGGSAMLVSPTDAFLRTNPNLTTAKNGSRKAAKNTATMKKSNGKNNAHAASMRFGNTPAANLKPPTASTMKNLPTLPSIGSLGSAFKQTSPTAALNTTHGKMFSQRSSMYNTNAANGARVTTASKRQLPFREKSVVASHRAGDKEVSFAKDTMGVPARTNVNGATTTTTRGNKNSTKDTAANNNNNNNNNTKVTAALAGGRKVRGRKNSVASVGADLAPTRLHFGGVSPPMSTAHKGSSRRSGVPPPMSMVLEASNVDHERMEVNNAPPVVEKPKAARLSSWFKPQAEVGVRATRSASKKRKSTDNVVGATTNGGLRK